MPRAWVGVAILAGSAGLLCAAFAIWNENGSRPNSISGKLEPVVALAGSRAGGAVSEVYVRQGERVRKGQVLLRFDNGQLQAQRRELASILHAAESAVSVPAQLRTQLVDAHPDVARVEADYVQALQQFDQSTGSGRAAAQRRLDLASENRQRVRRRIAHELSDQSVATPSLLQNLRQRLSEIDKLLDEAEVRAPSGATVDILDVKPGDRILPGHPAAMLVLSGEYFSDLLISETQAAKLQIGMILKGIFQVTHEPAEWRVESISKRTVPHPFRDECQNSQEILVRARVSSATLIPSGAIFEFQMP